MTAFTVALIGPDGAGKTTIGRRLEKSLPLPVRYLYMGVNAEASNALLPTTRVLRAIRRRRGAPPQGGPPDPRPTARERRGGVRDALREARSLLRLAHRLSEEWFRQALAWYHVSRGRVVLFDRHFFADYYAHDISSAEGSPVLSRRLHGFVLQHLYPRPDLMILLDAPAPLLWRRKQEGTLEALTRRRDEYLRLRDGLGGVEIVDVAQPEDRVLRDVTRLILARAGVRDALGAACPPT